MSTPLETRDIDINRRHFIKALLVLMGSLVLGKLSGLLLLMSRAGSATAPLARTLPIGTEEYRDARYGFSLRYPSDLTVSTFSEGGGAATVTFQNVEKGKGFQLFIVPHDEEQVSEMRFQQDVPSGVRESLTTLVVDGATGAAFDSTHADLGDTREVWMTHRGFLYELTTLKPLDAWLGDIVRTWKFV